MPPNVIEIILKGVDKSSGAFKKTTKASNNFKDSIKGLAKAATGAGVAIAAVGLTMKKVFDLGREGAAIQQTAESFDFLLDRMRVAPDLLDRLTAASNNTISTFELQSSTMKLLAGASGELGPALAEATPRLLEIAKAANKLNPSLGTTSFLYESIATGVKRAQPLILDNLGLVLKVGAANEAYALELGKTVEELTAQEKTMAILNATLLAGDEMIKQVGGDTESLTDSFDQLSVALKETVDEFKKELSPELITIIKTMTDYLTRNRKLKASLNEQEKAVRKSAKSWEEYDAAVKEFAEETNPELIKGANAAADILEFFGLVSEDTADKVDRLNEAEFRAGREINENTEFNMQLIDAHNDRIKAVEELTEETEELTEVVLSEASAAEITTKANQTFLAGIDRDIGSPIKNFIDDLEWFLATGGQFEVAFGRIRALAKSTPEEALDLSRELFGVWVDVKNEMGDLTLEEAQQELEDYGFSADEIREILGGSDSVQSALEGISDVIIDTTELEHVKAVAEDLYDRLILMAGRNWELRFVHRFLTEGGGGGGTPTAPSGGGEAPATPTGGQQETSSPTSTGGTQQNFYLSDAFDIEEVVGELANRVQEG